ncbi:hypothetical protein HanPI659440_Chr02g0084431 [Helianthus annuus]|nr:hypothetical protein HanPI659440_Chr02g0084431 [Helianthus annuus]
MSQITLKETLKALFVQCYQVIKSVHFSYNLAFSVVACQARRTQDLAWVGGRPTRKKNVVYF